LRQGRNVDMSARYCLECNTVLPDNATGGLCPHCALSGALSTSDGAAPLGHDRRFGDYELLEEIGRGGMGVVYRARQISLDRIVAIKMILPGLDSEAHLQRFRIEATTAAGLHHPNIVAIHEVGTWKGRQYLVMDYVEGPSLAQWTKDAGSPLSDFKRAARWTKTIAEAVQYAHERGVLHRDLKPSNVLIDEMGQPQVTDFGLAKRFEDGSLLTLSGQVVGSPGYMPPEQAESGAGKVSRRSDVYSLGATLYHLLTGQAPFQGKNAGDTLNQALNREPTAPRQLNPGIPRDLETICLKCLEKDPARRFVSAQMLAEDLGRFLESRPIRARPVGVPGKLGRWCRRKPVFAGLIAVLAASLVLAGWFGRQAYLASRLAEREQMQREVDRALAEAWAGDRNAAEQAISDAERHGAANEWIPMLRGQIALYSLQTDEAIRQFERAVTLAPRRVAAKAMLATAYLHNGQFDRYAEILGGLGELSPETPEDYLFLGAALVGGSPDSSKAVSLLEYAMQKHPSGVTFLHLALAEVFHAADAGSWPIIRKALEHCQTAADILGADHPAVLAVRLNACNFAMRLCPEKEREYARSMADEAARSLDSTTTPIGHMQRAFYFQIIGDEAAELKEWRKMVQQGSGGLYASYYAAAMLRRDRSAETLEVFNRLGLSADSLGALSCAFLQLDKGRPEEALTLYQRAAASAGPSRAVAETVLLLAGDSRKVGANSVQLLGLVPPQHPSYQTFRYYAGQISAEEFAVSAGSSRCGLCGICYQIAMMDLAKGDREGARQYFRRSIATGTHWLTQYQLSHAFLARLEHDPHWPPWIPENSDNPSRE
jgi:tetratricopeptide (TPR) repeat protein